MHADQILFVEDGRIVERGTHEELLALGGRYRALYDLQVRPERRPAAAAGGRLMIDARTTTTTKTQTRQRPPRAVVGSHRPRGGGLRQGLRSADHPAHLELREALPAQDAASRSRAVLVFTLTPARDPADHPLRHRPRHGGGPARPLGAGLGGRRLRGDRSSSTTPPARCRKAVVGKVAENVLFDMRRAMFAHLQRVSLSLHGQDRGRPADVAAAGRRQLDAGVPRDLGDVGRRHRAAVRHRQRAAAGSTSGSGC